LATRSSEHNLVSVVIPARNEKHFIARCLESVLSQDYANLQVIVVDGGSTDATGDIAARFAAGDSRIEVHRVTEGGIPTSLNVGLRAARGTWLVRVDAHSTIPSYYVRHAVEHLESGLWGGVGGRKDGVAITRAGRAIAAAMSSPFGVGGSLYHYGKKPQEVDHIPFGAYPTALIRELGGWDERLQTANEDFEFDYRIRQRGHRLLFDPELRIAWYCRQSVLDLFHQYRRYGHGKATVARLHPRSVKPRHLLPPGLVLLLAGTGLLALRKPRLATLVVLPYVSGVLIATASTSRLIDSRSEVAYLPAVFSAMHVGYGLGFWEGLAEIASNTFRRTTTVDNRHPASPTGDSLVRSSSRK
jgi:succinoglycan biosynthesis protein ExoA